MLYYNNTLCTTITTPPLPCRSGIYFHTPAQEAAAKRKVEEVNEKLARGEKV